ncbi:ABC transporter ATP-binding protein [Xylanibacillus composti]|uniref:ABC transporter ATP-binding protein n=1 Tax=Xylanibacillus composti TaxID=1572762 RepID=A0A8J4GZ01_9BACL|nr:ABC transporter ATP-binding protein [Xylanibacillus composti]MDT9723948.1 ABC transporter ATP-binding protein [Xylanibacillus composti]GIQ67828.1 ABC transporter ATP-binding protein [Xylanibacillus composti]
MKSRETVFEIQRLQVSYRHQGQSVPVLRNFSLALRKGEIVTVLGESGSGKSTMAKAVTGLLPPSAHVAGGTLAVGGDVIANLSAGSIPWERIRGTEVALLFQDARQALNPVMTIRQHFREALLHHRRAPAHEVATISSRLLGKLGFADPAAVLASYPFQLSGGMCQRVCLALALCLEPKVLIADEPTSALDTVSQREVLALLKHAQEEFGLAVLMITHDLEVAGAISDRIIVLHKGELVEEGEARTVLAQPQAAFTGQLLATRKQIAAPAKANRRRQAAAPLLEVRHLHKSFQAGRPVLRDVHLTLERNEILGILGQSGCGKSTLARCITGLAAVSDGSILLNGADITHLRGRARRAVCRQVQMVFQDARASLHPGRTALELVQEPLRYMRLGNRQEREMLAAFYLKEVGLEGELQHRKPPRLSTGQCQRIAIARALVLKPDALICDEAVSALDMRIQAQILTLLKRLHKQHGFSILMISHDVRMLRSFCHHIAVMHGGTFAEGKQASARLHESSQPHTQLLLACAGDWKDGLPAAALE